LLCLLDEIIDSFSIGLPLGNYLSQYLANFYLNKLDHWLKETKKIKHYLRYMDDIVILGNNKEELRNLFQDIKNYLNNNLKLTIKNNYQVFPISKRGIDFVGYVHYRNYTLLRKSIKKRFIKMIRYNKNEKSINSYNGWLLYGNCLNLRNKYLKNE